MKVITDIENIPDFDSPIALTLGVYDGVHLGHQAIIKHLHKQTRKEGTRVILTFSDHPSHVFTPNHPVPQITTLSHRLQLFEEYGMHAAIVLPFTQALAKQPYEAFIAALYAKLPFTSLTLGEGAAFGKDREGNAQNLTNLGKIMGFETHFLKKESHHKDPISSGRIRTLIEEGALKKVKKLLGRPYSLRAPFNPGEIIRENDTLYKWTVSFENMCLLPSAVYAIDIEGNEKTSAIGFLEGSHTVTGKTELSLTLFFERIPSSHDCLNIVFVEYMHNKLSPELLSPTNPLQKLFPQPSLS